MADKKPKAESKEAKIILERVYNVPLRKEWLKAPSHKRAKKAIRGLRLFLAQHMKAEFENIKVGMWANEHIWAQGTKKPPHHIQVKATKDDAGIVRAELTEFTVRQKIMQERSDKLKAELDKKPAKKEEKKEETKKDETKSEAKKEEEKKEEISIEKKEEKEVMKQEVVSHEHKHEQEKAHQIKKEKHGAPAYQQSHEHNR